jgi:organic radical activating enzyme
MPLTSKQQPNLDISGFHIEPTNICTLKCAGCARTRFIDEWPQHWKNHNLDINALLKFIDIDITDKPITLCGNYGDPIYHPDFIELVAGLKSRGANVYICTNGSYRKQEWWKELANILTTNDSVTFAVDGTPENFTKYRVNADWESIHTGMQVIADSPCKSIWKYIPFSYNQNDIDQVKQLSSDIGIKQFRIELSDRFDEQTEFLKPNNTFIGSRYVAQVQWKSQDINSTINPRCQNQREHFITAEGYYAPCCFLADHRFYYKTIFGKNKPQYNIQEHTISQIQAQVQTADFYQTLDSQPGCQYNCPNPSVDQ